MNRKRVKYTLTLTWQVQPDTLLGQAIGECKSIDHHIRTEAKCLVRDLLMIYGLNPDSVQHRQVALQAIERFQALVRSSQQSWDFESPQNPTVVGLPTMAAAQPPPDSHSDSEPQDQSYGLGFNPEELDEINQLLP